jgi:hypothetical protein
MSFQAEVERITPLVTALYQDGNQQGFDLDPWFRDHDSFPICRYIVQLDSADECLTHFALRCLDSLIDHIYPT